MADFQLNRAPWAATAMGFGALALMGAMIAVYAGPFAPQPKPGTALGAFTADFINATLRGLKGEVQPDPAAPGVTLDDLVMMAVAAGGALAVVLSIVALARRESRHLAIGALALGTAALVFQFVVWLALLICGVILILAIIDNIGDIFASFSG